MKLTSTFINLRRLLIVFAMLFALQPTAETSAQQALLHPGNQSHNPLAGSQRVSTTPSGCQWTYYPVQGGRLQPEQQLFNDPDNTPIDHLSLGNLFKGKTTQLARSGSTDFDGDNRTDVFRTTPRSDGNLQWQYSSGGTAPWQNFAYAGPELPTSQLQFGEFNGDNKTDVFANLYSFPAYHWVYSPGGVNSFVPLRTVPIFQDRLALGDFNGDGVTDVFSATQQNNTYQWAYAPGGNGSLIDLAFAGTDPALLRFGDFDSDGTTDVFAANQLADGSTQWQYSSGGAASYTNLMMTTVPYAELQFGDFDGDGKTDVLVAQPQSDGGLQAVYYPGALGPAVTLGRIASPAPALRVGDFNGDGISDLLALRCGMHGPLVPTPIRTLAQSGYATFYKHLEGDVNGDGLLDLILISTCQNPNELGACTTHHLQIGSTLATPSNNYTLVAPQQLGADAVDFTYYKFLTGDFDGDGKTDLAVMYLTGTEFTIYIARSNGNGTFTLGSPQTFTGETWSNFNPIVGDFNGDGKDDLAFATVCYILSGSCAVGNNNLVYVATSSGVGGFTLSARQDLGGSGWEDYYTYAGDFNGDGKTDLVFNSTCQKNNFTDTTCTIGDANIVYTALSNGQGGFSLSAQQTYGSSGWTDYPNSIDLIGDVNGDGRPDIVWTSSYQSAAKTNINLVVVGLANPGGTFQLGAVQNFGSAWGGRLCLADLNQDGRADLVWNNAPLGNTDVDTYATAISNGNGAFNSLGPGAIYTGPGYFEIPNIGVTSKEPDSLMLVSTRQDSISNALFVVNGIWKNGATYAPIIRK